MSSQYAPRVRPTTPSLSPRSIFCLCRNIRLSLGSIRRKRPSAHLPLLCSSLRNLGLSCLLTRSSFSSAPPRGGAGTEAAESPSPTGTWAGAPHEQPFPRVFKPQSLGPGCLLGVWGASDLGRGLRLQGANCPPAPHWPTFAFCLEPL